jgi:hypothetical protein
MPTSNRRWSPFSTWNRNRNSRRLTAAERARIKEEQRRFDIIRRACVARNNLESVVDGMNASALLGLALCRADELGILLRRLVERSQRCWDKARGRRSRRGQTRVMLVPVLPPAPEPNKRRRRRPVA